MPEGHVLHRAARLHAKRFAGHAIRASSPQGRFAEGAARLDGQVLESVDAYGKHIFYRFDSGDVLHVHLGLFGKFRIRSLPAPEPSSNARLVMETDTDHFHLAGPTACDVLTPDEADAIVARLGPDPILRPADGASRMIDTLARRTIPIGQALLDQSVVAGIGNVYRSEILYLTGVHPLTPSKLVDPTTVEELWDESVVQLIDGERTGRIITVTSEDSGARTAAARRKLARRDSVYVYKRDGQPCRRCGAEIETADAGGRHVWWCPEEQRR